MGQVHVPAALRSGKERTVSFVWALSGFTSGIGAAGERIGCCEWRQVKQFFYRPASSLATIPTELP